MVLKTSFSSWLCQAPLKHCLWLNRFCCRWHFFIKLTFLLKTLAKKILQKLTNSNQAHRWVLARRYVQLHKILSARISHGCHSKAFEVFCWWVWVELDCFSETFESYTERHDVWVMFSSYKFRGSVLWLCLWQGLFEPLAQVQPLSERGTASSLSGW